MQAQPASGVFILYPFDNENQSYSLAVRRISLRGSVSRSSPKFPFIFLCFVNFSHHFVIVIVPKYSGLWKSGAGATMGAHEPNGAFAFSSHL